jgi:hypothetical protein
MDADRAGSQERERSIASGGVGPLLQRDYWAVIANCSIRPDQFGELLARRFAEFAPDELAAFRRTADDDGPLAEGEELTVDIRLAGSFGIRVLDRDANSLTLSTLAGHPEAGRITFGAYRSDRGDVVFHIRSRARSSSRMHFAEYLTAGEGMQTATWASFLNAVARAVGDGVLGEIRATTEACETLPDDAGDGPTFIARGS